MPTDLEFLLGWVRFDASVVPGMRGVAIEPSKLAVHYKVSGSQGHTEHKAGSGCPSFEARRPTGTAAVGPSSGEAPRLVAWKRALPHTGYAVCF